MKSAMLIPVLGALLLAGCTSGGVSAPSQPPAEEKPATVAVNAAGPRPDAIPEGTWRQSVRSAESPGDPRRGRRAGTFSPNGQKV